MIQRLREFLTLALIGLLPLHALLVTVGTLVLAGPGNAPLPMLAVWKEALLVFILALTAVEWLVYVRRVRVDWIDLLIVALLIVGVAVSLYRPWMDKGTLLLGFKYDFIPLVAFLALRRVEWSDRFWKHAESVLLGIGGLVALYGILTFFAPTGFFRLLGYSDAHSLYNPGGPLAAFQQISGSSIRRIQSTFSGPNQFGLWLLLPLAFVLARVIKQGFRPKYLFVGGLLVLALFLTFSRSAWIGAFVMGCIALSRMVPRRIFIQVLVSTGAIAAIVVVAASLVAPSVLLRRTSTWGHIVRPLQAINEIQRYPLGMGLGMAGPASNRTHEPCVYLPPGSDPTWAKATPQLCVFVGSTQVQPANHGCECPMLPENWYLQVGVEMGVIGFILYIFLISIIICRLGMKNGKWKMENDSARNFQFSIFNLFVAVSVAGLFLHAWEDPALAYTSWIFAAAVLRR